MAGEEKTDGEQFTPEELERLRTREPGLLAALERGEIGAEVASRRWLDQAPVAVQLPLWPEPLRAVPNGFLRSALFRATHHKGRRRYVEKEQLAALDGIEVTYTGPRLDQGDLDTWEAILHTLRGQNMGEKCRTTSYQLLKVMGLKDTGKARKVLEARIERLNATAIKIDCGRYLYLGSLLDRAARDKETQEWVIVLNPDLLQLFEADRFTLIQWNTRRALATRPLAQWLHGYFSSHANPFPVKVETLHRLCGSEMAEMKNFTQTLKKALEALEIASAAAGTPFEWQIVDGTVYVKRTPTAAQRRHLERRGKQQR